MNLAREPIAVAIMAKAPRAGEVKTRLCPPLSLADAAELYSRFLLDKIEQVRLLKAASSQSRMRPSKQGRSSRRSLRASSSSANVAQTSARGSQTALASSWTEATGGAGD